MIIKIHKINKNDLDYVVSLDTNMANSSGMVISHYADTYKQTSATIPFEIEGVEKHVPILEDPEFSLSMTKKIDYTAIGVNSNVIKDIGRDTGKDNYVNNVPERPLDLPP